MNGVKATDPFRPNKHGIPPSLEGVIAGIMTNDALLTAVLRKTAWLEPEKLHEALLYRTRLQTDVSMGRIGERIAERMLDESLQKDLSNG